MLVLSINCLSRWARINFTSSVFGLRHVVLFLRASNVRRRSVWTHARAPVISSFFYMNLFLAWKTKCDRSMDRILYALFSVRSALTLGVRRQSEGGRLCHRCHASTLLLRPPDKFSVFIEQNAEHRERWTQFYRIDKRMQMTANGVIKHHPFGMFMYIFHFSPVVHSFVGSFVDSLVLLLSSYRIYMFILHFLCSYRLRFEWAIALDVFIFAWRFTGFVVRQRDSMTLFQAAYFIVIIIFLLSTPLLLFVKNVCAKFMRVFFMSAGDICVLSVG